MKNPMSNVVFGMVAATAYFKWQHSRCYFECAGSKVIEIFLQTKQAVIADSLDINLALKPP
jgi:hypothetical protein